VGGLASSKDWGQDQTRATKGHAEGQGRTGCGRILVRAGGLGNTEDKICRSESGKSRLGAATNQEGEENLRGGYLGNIVSRHLGTFALDRCKIIIQLALPKDIV
jgi:hypothetical protein